jgi:hypothetical protein
VEKATEDVHIKDSDDTTWGSDLPSTDPCNHLFGRPTKNTNLSDDMCKPFFDCEGVSFVAPTYSQDDLDWLETRVHLNPPDELLQNPYDHPEQYPNEEGKFCGLLFQDKEKTSYTLQTFDSMGDLEKEGARLTHSGACGHCSSLRNLAVYIENSELTGPVKSCATKGILLGAESTIKCLMNIGFDRPCAKVWYYNTLNTRSECMGKCLNDFFESKYHNPDGSLNDCIQCDEDKSGPVFKATSGRTRRNSGIPTALCRPCNTVTPVFHAYRD